MNRRIFLKSLATVCGAAVVCPGELLKSPVEFRPNTAQIMWMRGKDGSYIEGENFTPYMRWKNYYTAYKPPVDIKLLDELTNAVKNTKFYPPLRILGI